jgi:Fic family protein
MDREDTLNYSEVVEYWRMLNVGKDITFDCALDNFKILFAYNSGRIENDKIEYRDTYEIFMNGIVSGYTGNPRTLFEQQNQKTCYDFLLPEIEKRSPLTVNLVKEIHKMLTVGTYDERRYIVNGERPGEFKKHDYIVGRSEVGYLPGDVLRGIEDLISDLQGVKPEGENILISAAYFHAQFEYIHPFADGNGRTGRTLMNYYLLTHNYPPTIIREENRKEYYTALDAFDKEENLDIMVNFIKNETIATWSNRIARAREQNASVVRFSHWNQPLTRPKTN